MIPIHPLFHIDDEYDDEDDGVRDDGECDAYFVHRMMMMMPMMLMPSLMIHSCCCCCSIHSLAAVVNGIH